MNEVIGLKLYIFCKITNNILTFEVFCVNIVICEAFGLSKEVLKWQR